MKNRLLLLLLVFPYTLLGQYIPDILGNGFESRVVDMPSDYDGKVVCTLIRKPLQESSKRAILYVHGYNDYFFQTEMANRLYNEGYNFYAVDLRKYGRSHLPNQSFFMVKELKEYFADIDTCISIIRSEGAVDVTLIGHSTGGLITGLYAHERRDALPVDRLIHNSPFYDFNESWFMENIAIPVVSFLGKYFPDLQISQGESTAYAESLLKQHHGEWLFDTNWKKPVNKYIPACWFRAIHMGHIALQKGLQIPCPVLVLRSDKSVYGKVWTPDFQMGDAVLSVLDIAKYAKGIAVSPPNQVVVPNGLHDLALSNHTARTLFYENVIRFIKEN